MSKPQRLSYSRLNQFENCPKQFWYQNIAQLVQNTGSTATEYGTRIHEALELYGKGDDTTREGMLSVESEALQWFPLVDRILAQPGDKYFEYEMAVRRDRSVCEWDADDAWLRSIADVLIVNGNKAYCLDWKSGRKRDSPTQMQVFASMIFLHFPDVQEVTTSFVWLVANDTTDATYKRRYAESLWNALEPRFIAVQTAADTGVFPAKPSGLCPWCPAKDICPDARKKR
jgi:CRISPR/Cas system-associated exonuclease Cas4 (RecB family)